MSIVSFLLLVPLAAVAIWVDLLLLQAIGAALPTRALLLSVRRPRLAILIPAHNEAAGITATLDSITAQLRSGDRLLVVADNCDDDTAAVALLAGADVVARRDATRRGKGFALDCGVRHLAAGGSAQPPEVVIVIDADCVVEDGAIDYLARACTASGRPTQALYLMQSPRTGGAGPGPFGQLREFAWIVRNLVRPLGYLRLGQPCQLMGTGMAFPWPLISSAALANAQLVEDMQLGIDLACIGAAPQFCPQAVVRSEFPASKEGVQQQRRRWEHGHLGMILGKVPAMLVAAMKQKDLGLLMLALDLSVPPLALLVMLLPGLALLAVLTSSAFAFAFAASLLILLGVALLLAWWCHGRHVLKLRTLLLAPFYAIAKLPLYLGFLRRRQTEWVRSDRNS